MLISCPSLLWCECGSC